MKRLPAFAAAILLLFSLSLAENIDLSKYTTDELYALQERIARELRLRNAAEPGWFDYGIGAMLPKPASKDGKELKTGDFVFNDDTYFLAQIEDASKDDFVYYISAAAARGFTIEANRGDISYDAYNERGYHISIMYLGEAGVSVDADAPKITGTLSWPKSAIASLLPVPDSGTGSVLWDASYCFAAYVSYTKEQYDAYVDACAGSGFTVDYRKSDTYYDAYNADGYHLSLSYEGFNTMFVRIDEPAAK